MKGKESRQIGAAVVAVAVAMLIAGTAEVATAGALADVRARRIAAVSGDSSGGGGGRAHRGGAEETWVLELQATGALPFDVIDGAGAGEIGVRLYATRLGTVPESGSYPFGELALAEDDEGNAVLRIAPSTAEYEIAVEQGELPGIVRIRIVR